MHATFVDIENEFTEIAQEVAFLALTLAAWSASRAEPGTHREWELTHICASAVEKIYTGCERVMARIATEVDGTPVSHADGWHLALLRRMANPYPGVRAAVISHNCHHDMDRLRSFRHRERNTYGIHLDSDIVLERGTEALQAFHRFRNEVSTFFRNGPAETKLS